MKARKNAKSAVDPKVLDQALTKIVEKKNELSQLDYSDKNYDDVEEALHDLEDQFVDDYGEYLEEVLQEVHEEYCPDSEVLLPTAYLANEYVKSGENEEGMPIYNVRAKEGVIVEVEKTNKDARMVLLPNPTRLVLIYSNKEVEVAWQAGEEDE